ncbi:hypothetical protein Slin15195_G006230 [Septoria linicola]|uniref:Uncharacterized protein n=1 Tax=Septoria linicola TaxID=215465 RepID=A0A9Q9AGR0_9PEZI|nr:hypothetical protein Slin15195_G006230 [Septoria linicola]
MHSAYASPYEYQTLCIQKRTCDPLEAYSKDTPAETVVFAAHRVPLGPDPVQLLLGRTFSLLPTCHYFPRRSTSAPAPAIFERSPTGPDQSNSHQDTHEEKSAADDARASNLSQQQTFQQQPPSVTPLDTDMSSTQSFPRLGVLPDEYGQEENVNFRATQPPALATLQACSPTHELPVKLAVKQSQLNHQTSTARTRERARVTDRAPRQVSFGGVVKVSSSGAVTRDVDTSYLSQSTPSGSSDNELFEPSPSVPLDDSSKPRANKTAVETRAGNRGHFGLDGTSTAWVPQEPKAHASLGVDPSRAVSGGSVRKGKDKVRPGGLEELKAALRMTPIVKDVGLLGQSTNRASSLRSPHQSSPLDVVQQQRKDSGSSASFQDEVSNPQPDFSPQSQDSKENRAPRHIPISSLADRQFGGLPRSPPPRSSKHKRSDAMRLNSDEQQQLAQQLGRNPSAMDEVNNRDRAVADTSTQREVPAGPRSMDPKPRGNRIEDLMPAMTLDANMGSGNEYFDENGRLTKPYSLTMDDFNRPSRRRDPEEDLEDMSEDPRVSNYAADFAIQPASSTPSDMSTPRYKPFLRPTRDPAKIAQYLSSFNERENRNAEFENMRKSRLLESDPDASEHWLNEPAGGYFVDPAADEREMRRSDVKSKEAQAREAYMTTYFDEWYLGWLAQNRPDAPELSGRTQQERDRLIERQQEIIKGISDSPRTVFGIDEELPSTARSNTTPTQAETFSGSEAAVGDSSGSGEKHEQD